MPVRQSHSLQLNYHYPHDFLFIMLLKGFFLCQKSWQQAICLYQVTGNIIDLFFCRREWYLTLRKIVLYMWISQNPILDQSAWDQVAFSSRTSFQVYYGFFIDADTLLMSSDDDSPYSPEKRTKRPMGFPDSGIMQVAFEIVCHERKPPVFSHLVGLCMMR